MKNVTPQFQTNNKPEKNFKPGFQTRDPWAAFGPSNEIMWHAFS
jgi:hypothetical protein